MLLHPLWGGGYNSTSNIDKVSIATLGNAILFGDLSSGRGTGAGLASGTRGYLLQETIIQIQEEQT